MNNTPSPAVSAPMEATCTACGSVYRGAAIGGLDVDQWERREGVLHELWFCLCQRDRKGRDVARGSVVAAYPNHGHNIVLVRERVAGRIHQSIVVIVRATPTRWVGTGGATFQRLGASAGTRKRLTGDRDSYARIPPDELARLEAWAAAQKGGR